MTDRPMTIIGIDPGLKESASALFRGYKMPVGVAYKTNARTWDDLHASGSAVGLILAIEQVKNYGRRIIGDDLLLTAGWSFAFAWAYPAWPAYLIPRPTVGGILCGRANATKAETRQALIDRFGPGRDKAIGTRRKGMGPLYNVKNHAWDALAVAVAWDELRERGELDECYRVPRGGDD